MERQSFVICKKKTIVIFRELSTQDVWVSSWSCPLKYWKSGNCGRYGIWRQILNVFARMKSRIIGKILKPYPVISDTNLCSILCVRSGSNKVGLNLWRILNMRISCKAPSQSFPLERGNKDHFNYPFNYLTLWRELGTSKAKKELLFLRASFRKRYGLRKAGNNILAADL